MSGSNNPSGYRENDNERGSSDFNQLVTYEDSSQSEEIEHFDNISIEPKPKEAKVEEEDVEKESSEPEKLGNKSEIIVDPLLKPIFEDLTFENLTSYGCKTKCSDELQLRVKEKYENAKLHGINLNHYIKTKKEFKNPR